MVDHGLPALARARLLDGELVPVSGSESPGRICTGGGRANFGLAVAHMVRRRWLLVAAILYRVDLCMIQRIRRASQWRGICALSLRVAPSARIAPQRV